MNLLVLEWLFVVVLMRASEIGNDLCHCLGDATCI